MADPVGSTTWRRAMPLPGSAFLHSNLRFAVFALLSATTATFLMNIAESGSFGGRPVLETYATLRMFVDTVVAAVSPRAVQRGSPAALEVDGIYVLRLAASAVYFYLCSQKEAQQIADTRIDELLQALDDSFAEHPPRRSDAENEQELWTFMTHFALLADCVHHTLDSGRDISISRDALNLLLRRLLDDPLRPDRNGNPKRARGTSASSKAPRFVKLEFKILRTLTESAPVPRDTHGSPSHDAQLSESDGEGATTGSSGYESGWSNSSWTSAAAPDVARYEFGGEQQLMDIPQQFPDNGASQLMHLQPFALEPQLHQPLNPRFYSTTDPTQAHSLNTYQKPLHQDNGGSDELPFSDEEWAALERFADLSESEVEQFLLNNGDL